MRPVADGYQTVQTQSDSQQRDDLKTIPPSGGVSHTKVRVLCMCARVSRDGTFSILAFLPSTIKVCSNASRTLRSAKTTDYCSL